MASLKLWLPVLGELIDMTPDALYSRQRALVELGLLDYIPGRGPGSGAPLNPRNVAALLVAILATDNASEADQRVVTLADAPFNAKLYDGNAAKQKRCPVTHKAKFIESLTEVLSNEELARRADEISVDRQRAWATICFLQPGAAPIWSHFGVADPFAHYPIRTSATIGSDVLQQISALLSEVEE